MKHYTVTATATYFVQATDEDEATNIVYEALLGDDQDNILGGGEIHCDSLDCKEGTHYTIPLHVYRGIHGLDVK